MWKEVRERTESKLADCETVRKKPELNFSWLVLDAFCCSFLLYPSYQKTKVSLPIVLLRT